MKKINAKGFTLIELLAVITIMGILMIVAIPAISKTIENSRKDQFLDTAKQYVNGVKNLWVTDEITCDGEPASAAAAGVTYYVSVSSAASGKILESGGKSSWGNDDVDGYVLINVSETDGVRKNVYSVALRDTKDHGIPDNTTDYLELGRGDVDTTGVTAIAAPEDAVECTLN